MLLDSSQLNIFFYKKRGGTKVVRRGHLNNVGTFLPPTKTTPPNIINQKKETNKKYEGTKKSNT